MPAVLPGANHGPGRAARCALACDAEGCGLGIKPRAGVHRIRGWRPDQTGPTMNGQHRAAVWRSPLVEYRLNAGPSQGPTRGAGGCPTGRTETAARRQGRGEAWRGGQVAEGALTGYTWGSGGLHRGRARDDRAAVPHTDLLQAFARTGPRHIERSAPLRLRREHQKVRLSCHPRPVAAVRQADTQPARAHQGERDSAEQREQQHPPGASVAASIGVTVFHRAGRLDSGGESPWTRTRQPHSPIPAAQPPDSGRRRKALWRSSR